MCTRRDGWGLHLENHICSTKNIQKEEVCKDAMSTFISEEILNKSKCYICGKLFLMFGYVAICVTIS